MGQLSFGLVEGGRRDMVREGMSEDVGIRLLDGRGLALGPEMELGVSRYKKSGLCRSFGWTGWTPVYALGTPFRRRERWRKRRKMP